jgi:hypothetical protein
MYSSKDVGLSFVPYTGSGSGAQQNSKYVRLHLIKANQFI